MARGGNDYVMFRDIEPVLPVADSPTLAYEVIDLYRECGDGAVRGRGKDYREVRVSYESTGDARSAISILDEGSPEFASSSSSLGTRH
jgi:hypothetical protein